MGNLEVLVSGLMCVFVCVHAHIAKKPFYVNGDKTLPQNEPNASQVCCYSRLADAGG